MGSNGTMIFIIIFFMLKSTNISLASGHTIKEKFLIEKVSGDDDNGEPKALIFEKFKALFGFRSLNGQSPLPSPSPSPSPAPSPMVVHHHGYSHMPHHHHSYPKGPEKNIHKRDKNGVFKRVLIAVLVSVGAALVLLSIGFIWVCNTYRKKRKRSTNTMRVLARRNGGVDKGKKSAFMSSSTDSVKKVSFDPGLDQFYLESIESALKPQSFYDMVPSSKESTSNSCKIVESEQETKKSDCEKAETSIEIVSVHESAESVAYESDGFNSISCDRIGDDWHSSDDESFHSFCDSHLSSENISPKVLSLPTIVESVSSSKTIPKKDTLAPTPPPPPPPPPIPPRSYVSNSHYSSSHSTPIQSKALSSPTLRFSLSPTDSNSSSGSNQTPQHELILPPKPSGAIPPPPCLPPPLMKFGKDGEQTLAKLKPLHWDKVRAAPDRSMVWDKLRTNSFEFDEEMMESLFSYNLQSSLKSDEAKSKSPSPTKHLLEPKRLQNITILSKALNVTAEQVCEALIQGRGLCLQQLEALSKMVPTKEEEAKLSSYKGDTNGLSSAELLVKTMLELPFAFSRIEAMLYRETFEDEVVHLRKSFSMLEDACKELRSSRLFLKLLEAVLKTGNRMNIGTMRGGAKAFKLDALLKLADVKGTDGKTTLLHFVVQEIIRSEGIRVSESIMGKINLKNKTNNVVEKEENCRNMGLDLVLGLSTELCNVKKTATIDLDVLASSVSNLSDGMVKSKILIGKELFGVEKKKGDFVKSMGYFLEHAERIIKELREDENRVISRVKEITEYFHGNVSKDEVNLLRIFVIVRDFLGMLDHVCKELRSIKISSSPNPLAPFR